MVMAWVRDGDGEEGANVRGSEEMGKQGCVGK